MRAAASRTASRAARERPRTTAGPGSDLARRGATSRLAVVEGRLATRTPALGSDGVETEGAAAEGDELQQAARNGNVLEEADHLGRVVKVMVEGRGGHERVQDEHRRDR